MQNAVNQLLDNSAVSTGLTLLAVGVVALWLAAAWWTYQDMQRRTTSELASLGAVAWVLLSTPAMLPLALPIYLLARPQATVAQGRSRDLAFALEAELSDAVECPGCGSLDETGWRRCPTCATWLETECEGCGRWSSITLDICPWCAVERPALGNEGILIGEPSALATFAKPETAARPTVAAGRRAETRPRRQVPARLG
jgi:hypothetical protein